MLTAFHAGVGGAGLIEREGAVDQNLDLSRAHKRKSILFDDLRDGARWTLALNDGRWPSWLFNPQQRAPGTGIADYIALARLAMEHGGGRSIGDMVPTAGPICSVIIPAPSSPPNWRRSGPI